MRLAKEKQRVLITGGTGFIGSQLCNELSSEGHQVTVLTRDRRRARRMLGAKVTAVERLDEQGGDEPVDIVVNLAGAPLADRRWNQARKRLFYDSRIKTTNRLCEFFEKRGQRPRVLVSGSAVGYYGPHGDEILDEQGDPSSSFSHDLCADWESAAEAFTDFGTRVCRIRTGIVLDAGGGALQRMLIPFRLGLGGPIGSGDQWMSWIHRRDIVNLIYHCINHEPLYGPFNGTAPNPVRNREFAETLAAVLRRPAKLTAPPWAMRMLFGEMADEILLAGQRVVPTAALESGFEFRYPRLEDALRGIVSGGD